MASMNWLGFSLYPQQPAAEVENSHHQTVVNNGSNSHEGGISSTEDGVSGECYDLLTTTTLHEHSLNHHPSFGIVSTPHQDWGTKGNYNNQTLLLGTSCNSDQNLTSNHQHQQNQPKLENFLGQHSSGENHHHTHQDHHAYGGDNSATGYPSCSLQLPAAISLLPKDEFAACGNGSSARNMNIPKTASSSSIGLSMIKSWLRNQPPQQKSSSDADAAASAAKNISLSMNTVSQTMALPLLRGNNNVDGESSSSENNNNNNKQQQNTSTTNEGGAIVESAGPNRKATETFGQRTSIYRGVTRHRWTGRYEAHLWDNSCRREGQTRKGRQVYLGGYDKEEKAARAYDLAALKYWGTTTTINFPISNYEKELEEMKHMTRLEYIASLRRKSSGFSRGASIYRGVTRHHQHGRWQARIGRVAGNKDLYLGTYSTQEEAAEAYDIAAIKFRGLNAVTNFEMSRYNVKSILDSTNFPIGGGANSAAKRLKDNSSNNVEQIELSVETMQKSALEDHSNMSFQHLSYGANWLNSIPFQQQQQQPHQQHFSQILSSNNYPYGNHIQKFWCKQEVQDPVDASHQSSYESIRHQLQLGSTHNFFHQSNSSGVHSFMSIDHDSASIDNNSSASSNPIFYSDGGNGGYMIPIGNDGNNQNHQKSIDNGFSGDNNEMKLLGGYENAMMNYSADPYHANRHLYYLPQQSAAAEHEVKGSDQFDACNNTTWVPTSIPTNLAAATSRTDNNNNMVLCTGAPPFTLLHE